MYRLDLQKKFRKSLKRIVRNVKFKQDVFDFVVLELRNKRKFVFVDNVVVQFVRLRKYIFFKFLFNLIQFPYCNNLF